MHRTPLNSTDREMVEDPDAWPMWPYLPMKLEQESGWPKLGFFYNGSFSSNEVTFYEGKIFGGVKGATKTELTVEQVLAAGWVVD